MGIIISGIRSIAAPVAVVLFLVLGYRCGDHLQAFEAERAAHYGRRCGTAPTSDLRAACAAFRLSSAWSDRGRVAACRSLAEYKAELAESGQDLVAELDGRQSWKRLDYLAAVDDEQLHAMELLYEGQSALEGDEERAAFFFGMAERFEGARAKARRDLAPLVKDVGFGQSVERGVDRFARGQMPRTMQQYPTRPSAPSREARPCPWLLE